MDEDNPLSAPMITSTEINRDAIAKATGQLSDHFKDMNISPTASMSVVFFYVALLLKKNDCDVKEYQDDMMDAMNHYSRVWDQIEVE